MSPTRAVFIGAIFLCLTGQAARAVGFPATGNTGSGTVTDSHGASPLVHAPDATQGSAGDRPPTTGPLPEESDDGTEDLEKKLGPVALGAMGIVMAAGLGFLILTGNMDWPHADADTTYGLRPER